MLLFLDADDTLWENNVYFERAIEQFIEFVNHQSYTRGQVREILNDIERANTALHGYGSAAFGRNLAGAFQKLAAAPVTGEQMAYVEGLAAAIAREELELIPGVPETLEYLAARHRLVLLTKGCEDEQRAKLARSGLGGYYAEALVVREKDRETYTRALEMERGFSAGGAWMVGNSPRSDINPALAAGLNAVWVPHPATWTLEHEEVRPAAGNGVRLLVLERFSDLREHF